MRDTANKGLTFPFAIVQSTVEPEDWTRVLWGIALEEIRADVSLVDVFPSNPRLRRKSENNLAGKSNWNPLLRNAKRDFINRDLDSVRVWWIDSLFCGGISQLNRLINRLSSELGVYRWFLPSSELGEEWIVRSLVTTRPTWTSNLLNRSIPYWLTFYVTFLWQITYLVNLLWLLDTPKDMFRGD